MKKSCDTAERKGQVATEYLVIVGFILIILIPITIIYFKYTGSTSDVVGQTKTKYLAGEIVKAANDVYSFGQDSQKKIKLSFPDGLVSVTLDRREIIFKYKDSKGRENEIVEVADVEFASTTFPVSAGQKELVVRSLGTRVAVTIACNNDETKTPGDSASFLALCPDKSTCTLSCLNKAWTAIDCQ